MFQKSLTVKDKDDILLLEIKALSKSKGGFVMEVIVADQIIMGLILNAGDAKQHIYQALSYAKEGDFTSSEDEIAKADAALLEAHNLQTQFLAQEAGGTKTEITALFVHSQDHLMTSITEINLIKEMIDLRKELSAKQ
ncbi:putative N,N'-diacetylchitobiose-specific phosphotransferase enzyme IIA component [Streptococcus parasanguinis ATCC 15912]|jgi:PTS system cellobiose-specific IIA component|uniref:Putative N,N'-diacetylchitobiose-specific phosphotransferase enzyme IIA component n=2 Tax=Streptococcus parasanguinis TaxID=1318 RepID=F8DH44_STREP|nr:putative N,N'-diacetylchitobiose-specific phosphotransferase enzyme IIA component [Streptococcus parasanguinis ATCC 15912]